MWIWQFNLEEYQKLSKYNDNTQECWSCNIPNRTDNIIINFLLQNTEYKTIP